MTIDDARPWQPREALPGVVYPPQARARHYAGLGILGRQTLPGLLREAAARHGERPALVSEGLTLSHRELDALTDRVAAGLLALGLKPLERVLMHVADSPEQLVAFIATLKAGLIPISTLAAYREQEIGQLTEQADARMIWADGRPGKFDHVAFAERMAAAHPGLRQIVAVGGSGGRHPSLESLAASHSAEAAAKRLREVALDPWQVAVFQLSGGTSGTPKIIPRFHSEYAYNLQASAQALDLHPDDLLYMPVPMMHNLHTACGWGPVLTRGGAVLLTPQPTPDAIARAVSLHRPTRLCLPPPLLAKASASPHWDRSALAHVRGMMAPFGARGLAQTLGVNAFHVFGMTEGVIMYSCGGRSEEARLDTVGRPISAHDEIRLLRPGTEEPVAEGEVGELAIRGPYTLFGYYRAPERNADAFTHDGFYRSGDLMSTVRLDGELHYRFHGRLKDVVDRAGEKVNAEEVEQAVMRCGGFLAVVVVGAPDPVFTERVCACVIPRPGHPVPDVATLGRQLEALGLAKFKWPERIEVLEAVPVTHAGKPDKLALKRQLFPRDPA